MIAKIVLFDIDGVLIESRGYRAATMATLSHLYAELGLKFPLPSAQTIGLMESFGITNEWDMIAFCISMILQSISEETGQEIELRDWADIPALTKLHLPENGGVDYDAGTRRLSRLLVEEKIPTLAVLEGCLNNPADSPFPYLARQPFFRQFYTELYDARLCRVTSVFQNLTLGSDVFRRIYLREPDFYSPSLLSTEDIPLASPHTLERIKSMAGSAALYTARASRPPKNFDGEGFLYPPEAEIAVEKLGLESLPLISTGRVLPLADASGRPFESLVKPAPVQALAAIAAAWTQAEWPALQWALSIFENAERKSLGSSIPAESRLPVSLPQQFELHIFEDSAGGILAGKKAARLLIEAGFRVHLFAWGIGSHPDKVKRLQEAGAKIYPDINTALEQF